MVIGKWAPHLYPDPWAFPSCLLPLPCWGGGGSEKAGGWESGSCPRSTHHKHQKSIQKQEVALLHIYGVFSYLVSFYFLFYRWEEYMTLSSWDILCSIILRVFFNYFFLGWRLPPMYLPAYILLLAADKNCFQVCLFHRTIYLYLVSNTVNVKISPSLHLLD